ncbi:MAG: 1,2-phenylacetyl-CoA epoxidase subunit B [Chitinophagaceae bacterium]|nr:MAG: 1,2-phenylacetyl-CoA epoxidase subunit B [Chitinophagaceae bacterium]
MQLFRKYYYGDYDAIKGGAGSTNEEKAPAATAPNGSAPLSPGAGSGVRSWPLWEIFIRSKQGLDHKHVGSLHAADAAMAIENARDVYTRRQEGVSIWAVESKFIHASNPDDAESFYEPAADKVYRHPTFYDLPDELTHM